MDIRSLEKHFKEEFPDFVFHVTIRKLSSKHLGLCSRRRNGEFIISLASNMSNDLKIQILIHEMAHVLSWDHDTHPSRHGRHWGTAYSKVYRSYLKWVK